MKPLAIARVNLVRFFRDRSAVFSVFLLPMLIVLLLGAMQGGASVPKLGFVSAAGDALTTELLERAQAINENIHSIFYLLRQLLWQYL